MRVSALILLVAVGTILGATHPASAEKVKTNQTTKLHSRPGEQSKVLLKVKPGQSMTLLDKEGRWLKVRVQGRTGYVPRSKVDMADDDEIVRNTRRRPFVDGRSRRRGFGGDSAPEDRIGADAVDVDSSRGDEEDEEEEEEEEPRKKPAKKTAKVRVDEEDEEDEEEDDEEPTESVRADDEDDEGDEVAEDEDDEDPIDEEPEEKRVTARVSKKVSVYEEADPDSEEKFIARPTDVLYPSETKGEWTAVENEEGDFGWIETDFLEMEDEGGVPGGKRQINVSARLGLMFIQQGMRTQGSTNLKVPDNYNIGTSAATISLGGGILMPMKKKYLVGGEVTYDYSKTVLGGVYYDPDGKEGPMPGVNTPISLHNINVRGTAGIDLKKKSGMAVLGRLGYRYQSYLVSGYADTTKNPAKIPQEVVKGPAFGAAFLMPRLTDKIGMRVSLDAILFGASVKQTKGLEDGAVPTTKAFVVGAGFTYKWKKNLDLAATYDLRYMKIDFGPPIMDNMRGHMGTNVARTDIFHMVTVGVAKPF